MADQSIYKLFQSCTVRIKTSREKGTGFFVAPGKILTCNHVLEAAKDDEIEIYWKDKKFIAEDIEKIDRVESKERDLALLTISYTEHPCVYLDREADPHDQLYSYGFPDEGGFSISPICEGRSKNEQFLTIKHESIRHGLSGAPLLNRRTWKVCGIIKSRRKADLILNVLEVVGGQAIPAKVIFDQWIGLESEHDRFHYHDPRWRSLIPRVIGKLTFEGLTLTFLSRLGIRVDVSVLDKQFSEPVPRLKSPPVPDRPRREMGYKNAFNKAVEALKVLDGDKKVTGFYGEPESEEWLLEKIAHADVVTSFPGGVVDVPEGDRYLTALDLLEKIFYDYYEEKDGIKYGAKKIKSNLQDRKALVLVHNTKLSSEQVRKLCNEMPGSGFVFTWRKGDPLASVAQSIFKVGKLELDDALDVVAEEFIRGRAKTQDELFHFESGGQWRDLLKDEDRQAAEILVELKGVNGHPQKIRRAVELAKSRKKYRNQSLQETVEEIRKNPLLVSLDLTKIVESLSKPDRRILKLLAVLGVAGSSLLIALFANAAEIPNISKHLNSLAEQDLVQVSDSKYQLTSDISEVLNQATHLTDVREEALNHFTTLVEQQIEPSQVFENVDAISNILEWAFESGRYADVIKLGQGLEGALVFNGLWGMWERVLQWELQASQALNDGQSISWALHQLGTRALSLGDSSTARSRLTQALTL
ncbi:serine protease [Phormidesmis sp. 146-12]